MKKNGMQVIVFSIANTYECDKYTSAPNIPVLVEYCLVEVQVAVTGAVGQKEEVEVVEYQGSADPLAHLQQDLLVHLLLVLHSLALHPEMFSNMTDITYLRYYKLF